MTAPQGRTIGGFTPIRAPQETRMQDHRRWPGCRLLLVCAACTWAKGYNPERVLRRLQQRGLGGNMTRVADVAQHVGWDCPRCRRVRWAMRFAWPAGITEAEIKRLMGMYRN